MEILERFVAENDLCVKNVRGLVDDYSLISYYIGAELELNTCYSSPLREDDTTPSFSLFYPYGKHENIENKLFFKDHVIGSGDVYEFLSKFFGAPIPKVLEQINFDLGLNLGSGNDPDLKKTIIKAKPLVKERPKLGKIAQPPTQVYKDYWKTLGITDSILHLYEAECLKAYQLIFKTKTITKAPIGLMIGYSIGDRHKIYRPKASKKDKFRTDYLPNYVEGHLQLDWSRNDLLVITKATKECMFFRQHFNIQAVAGKSESTEIDESFIRMYLNHFKKVIVWLDPDEAGRKMSNIYNKKYGIAVREMPSYIPDKDPTDLYTTMGPDSLPIILEVVNNDTKENINSTRSADTAEWLPTASGN